MSIILAMCQSMMLYFTWSLPPIIVNFVTFIVLIPLIFRLKFKRSSVWIVFLLLCCYLYNYLHTPWSYIELINTGIVFLITAYVILSSKIFKLRLYNYFDCFLKFICAVSLFGWCLYFIGIPLPHYHSDTTDFYSHEVFYMFIMNDTGNILNTGDIFDLLPRFCGMFLEPGHIGSTACLMLYINQFNFKDQFNYIYLLTIVLSLSLAAYCLFFIGLILFYFLRGKNVVKYLTLILFLMLMFVVVGMTYNGGDNIIQEQILERLVIEDDGQLSGDNRTTYMFDYYYNKWLKNGNLLIGYGSEAYGNGSPTANLLHGTASYKRFFFINGIAGVILVLFLYFIILKGNYSRIGIGLLLLIIICNMIRDYPYRMMWLYIYITGLTVLRNNGLTQHIRGA